MSILTIIFIAIGLAMDCFAVSTSQGLSSRQWKPQALLMALLFGIFQGGMPMIGYFAGSVFSNFFDKFAPWIALALLSFIGGKMLIEGIHIHRKKRKTSEEDSSSEEEPVNTTDWSFRNLILLAVATSIDALATGVIFIPVPEVFWIGMGIIAAASFLFSLFGFGIGVWLGHKFRLNTNVLGGLILIAIGLKIWFEAIIPLLK